MPKYTLEITSGVTEYYFYALNQGAKEYFEADDDMFCEYIAYHDCGEELGIPKEYDFKSGDSNEAEVYWDCRFNLNDFELTIYRDDGDDDEAECYSSIESLQEHFNVIITGDKIALRNFNELPSDQWVVQIGMLVEAYGSATIDIEDFSPKKLTFVIHEMPGGDFRLNKVLYDGEDVELYSSDTTPKSDMEFYNFTRAGWQVGDLFAFDYSDAIKREEVKECLYASRYCMVFETEDGEWLRIESADGDPSAAIIDCAEQVLNNVSQTAPKLSDKENESELVFRHDAILITVNKSVTTTGLYDAVRYCWRVKKARVEQYPYVMAVVQGVIKDVYKVHEWKDATIENFPTFERVATDEGRYGFVGELADDDIRLMYIGQKVPSQYRKKGASNPVRYVSVSGIDDSDDFVE